MKIKKEIRKKTISLFLMILVVTTTISFSISLSSSQVKAAEQEGCCLDTGKGQQCVTTSRTECPGRFYTGPPFDCSNINECQPGTCIPLEKSEPCLRNKPAADCLAMGGVPDSKTLEEIPQCKPGCCIIARGLKAEVLQFRQCENLTRALGYNVDMMDFREGIISQIECKKAGSPSDLGCCVVGGGSCKYGARANCSEGNFVPLQGGLFCRDVSQCALTTHNYADCGKIPGTETDIYWYDSQGNQEEIYDVANTSEVDGNCNYPENFCTKSISGAVECKTTSCKIEGSKDAQKMSDNPPKVESESIEGKGLLTGTSLCYNFYTHFSDNAKIEEDMKGVSTGLQNEILYCGFGKIEIQGLGPDRQRLCDLSKNGSLHGTPYDNKWQNCTQCGQGGALDFLGNFFGPFPPLGRLFEGIISKSCTKADCEGTETALGLYGDCVYKQKEPSLVLTVPVASCVPKYPPGTNALSNSNKECGKCGNGIVDIWNICSQEECEGLGDCTFKSYGGLTTPLIILYALGSFIAGRVTWLPLDCVIAGPIFYKESGGMSGCFKARYTSWWFKGIKWPYDLAIWVKDKPVAGISTILGSFAMVKGLFGK
jgi:hypothetical protein